MNSRRFLYVSAGVLMLAISLLIAFHLGQSTANAQNEQAKDEFTGICWSYDIDPLHNPRLIAITRSGDLYARFCFMKNKPPDENAWEDLGGGTKKEGWKRIGNVMDQPTTKD